MLDSIQGFLEDQPVVVVCLVLAAGYLIGKIRIKGFGLGSVTGVLFAALVFGHYGFEGNDVLQAIGFAFFMYVVGFEAGPRVWAVMRQDGTKYLVLALLIAASGFVTAMLLGRLLGLQPGAVSGAMAGGMTTTPTLAAAQDAVRSGQVTMPDGVTADQVVANITTGYAITYLVGLIGLIVIIKLLPLLLGLDLAGAAAELDDDERHAARPGRLRVVVRAHRIRPDSHVVGMTLREAEATVPGKARVVKVRRGAEFHDPQEDELRIEPDDCITIVGGLTEARRGAERLGPELDDHDLLDLEAESAQVVVTRRDAAGRSLEELGVTQEFGCIVNQVGRTGVILEPTPSLVVQRGDVLTVTAPEPYLERLGAHLGHLERDIAETDLLTLMLGVAAGVTIGTFTVKLGNIPVGLGTAGGVLLMGILLGYLRSIHPTFGRVPSGARWFIMEAGLLLFMSGVGLEAGHTVVETLRSAGLSLLLMGIAVAAVPVLVGLLAGRILFRMNLALLLGAITGAMTSTAAMRVVCAEARSNAPALGYAGAYALANVILAVAGYLIIRFELMM